ncbi:Zinc finger, C2H2-like [Penicillium digitatum]|uniref:Zinc finger, C2H2-like n=1 Tax=Penicillium digitatum TaxID=36651 RepID=A0A7T6XW60_PENDI|nr:Zinc finger, C2H2-like [Penicillium digitatum]
MSYLSSRPCTACTTPSGSESSAPFRQERLQPGIRGPEARIIYGATRRIKPKHDKLYGTYQCKWKDCKYRSKFSHKGVLLRHIETQHVAPHSFECTLCGKLFSRQDNWTDHMGKFYLQRV